MISALCLGVESRLPTGSPQMDLNGSAAAVSSSVDSAGGSSNKARSFTAEMLNSSHHEAARTLNDPGFLSIEYSALLQQRTSTTPAISSSPAVAVELIRSFSFNSLKEVTGCFLNKNQDDVVRIILENCKKDVWKNGELSCLVEEYFGINSLEPLHKFTMTLDKCLNEVRERQLMAPLRCFEEENEAEKGDGEYARTTLEELRSLIKAAGDLFREQLQSVNAQQLSVMEKLERRKQKVDKKLKSIKKWRKVSTITFASTFAAVLVGSVVAAAMAAPPVAAALAAAASVPVGSMGKWFNSLWKKYEDALKGEKELISAMIGGTRIIAIKDQLASIPHVVEQLEIQIDAILVAVDSALGDEEAVKIGIGEIKRKLGDFMGSIEDLGKQVDRCTGNVMKARTVVLQKVSSFCENYNKVYQNC